MTAVENRARLWYCSEVERRRGAPVEWDPELRQWVADGCWVVQAGERIRVEAARRGRTVYELTCSWERCGRTYQAKTRGRGAGFCSARCKQKAARRRWELARLGLSRVSDGPGVTETSGLVTGVRGVTEPGTDPPCLLGQNHGFGNTRQARIGVPT